MRDLGHGEQGARAALPMWVEIMTGRAQGRAAVAVHAAAGRRGAQDRSEDGPAGAAGRADAIDEVFLEGTAPTQVAPAAGEANPDTFITDQAQ